MIDISQTLQELGLEIMSPEEKPIEMQTVNKIGEMFSAGLNSIYDRNGGHISGAEVLNLLLNVVGGIIANGTEYAADPAKVSREQLYDDVVERLGDMRDVMFAVQDHCRHVRQ